MLLLITMILITGGAGFVGKHLVQNFLDTDEEITIFDNFSNSTQEKISPLLKKGVSLIRGDIRNYDEINNSLENCHTVVHLAAQIDVDRSIDNPDETFEINVEGTRNLLNACIKNKIRNVIAASSAAVYGYPKELPLKENSSTIPISPYGQSKLSMEKLLKYFSKKNNLNSISLRFFNIYGEDQTDAYAGVITKFMNNISKNRPLTVFGDGSNTRDFISVDDVANSIKCAIEKIENKKGNCYNIATGNPITISDLANLMLSISGKKLDIIFTPNKPGDITHSQASIVLAKNDLNFISKTPLKLGLEQLLQ